jgi:hypothetical protein
MVRGEGRQLGNAAMPVSLEAAKGSQPRRLGMILLAAALLATPARAADPPAVEPATSADPATPPDPLAECLAPTKSGRKPAIEDEFCLLRLERIGHLSIGIGEKEAIAALSCPVSKGKNAFSDATGDYDQKWSFPACGVDLTMSSSSRSGPKVVTAIVVAAPSTLTTTKGIGIGSTEEEVLAAYGPLLDRGATRRGKTVVAGSIYGGMIISIAEGKVSEIFLGAIAE